jgi:hypothetical protein
MAKFKTNSLAIAFAAGVMALAAPIAQANEIFLDYTFTTPNTNGYTATGNILLTVDTTNLGGSALAPTYPFDYNITAAAGTVTFSGSGPTIVDDVTLGAATATNIPDNIIYTSAPIGPGASFAWDSEGLGIESTIPPNLFIDFSGNTCSGPKNAQTCTATYLLNGADSTISSLNNLPTTSGNYQQENLTFQSLTAVPAPLPIAMIGAALLGIGFVGQRKRRAS